MWFLIGVAVGLVAGFVIFRMYWSAEIEAGKSALAKIKNYGSGVIGKL